MLGAMETRSPEMQGVVALGGSRVVGWLKLAPAGAVEKLYAQRVYRRLPCFDGPRDGVLAVGCLLVDPEWRKRGVARALVHGAIALGREQRARALEAFPRRAEGLRDEEAFTGPFAVFVEAGFEIVHDFQPYPVLRLNLG
jgi:GNAT superfamily N-acetyltransferase